MSYFGATGTPVLDFWWRLLWVSKPEWFCLIRIAEANVMYISWDPPLVLHVADFLTDSIAGRQPGSYLAQGYYCVAAVSLEPAINRSWSYLTYNLIKWFNSSNIHVHLSLQFNQINQ